MPLSIALAILALLALSSAPGASASRVLLDRTTSEATVRHVTDRVKEVPHLSQDGMKRLWNYGELELVKRMAALGQSFPSDLRDPPPINIEPIEQRVDDAAGKKVDDSNEIIGNILPDSPDISAVVPRPEVSTGSEGCNTAVAGDANAAKEAAGEGGDFDWEETEALLIDTVDEILGGAEASTGHSKWGEAVADGGDAAEAGTSKDAVVDAGDAFGAANDREQEALRGAKDQSDEVRGSVDHIAGQDLLAQPASVDGQRVYQRQMERVEHITHSVYNALAGARSKAGQSSDPNRWQRNLAARAYRSSAPAIENMQDADADNQNDPDKNYDRYMDRVDEVLDDADDTVQEGVDDAEDTYDRYMDRVDDIFEDTDDTVQDGVDDAEDTYNRYVISVDDILEDADDTMQDALDDAEDTYYRHMDRVDDVLEDTYTAVQNAVDDTEDTYKKYVLELTMTLLPKGHFAVRLLAMLVNSLLARAALSLPLTSSSAKFLG